MESAPTTVPLTTVTLTRTIKTPSMRSAKQRASETLHSLGLAPETIHRIISHCRKVAVLDLISE